MPGKGIYVSRARPAEGSGLLGRPIPVLSPTPIILSSVCWTASGFYLFVPCQAPGLGLQAPEQALRSRGKQVLGLAECWVRCGANGGGQALAMVLRVARQAPLSTAASFALDFLGFFPTVPNLSSRGTSSYQGKGTGARERAPETGVSSRGGFPARCLH